MDRWWWPRPICCRPKSTGKSSWAWLWQASTSGQASSCQTQQHFCRNGAPRILQRGQIRVKKSVKTRFTRLEMIKSTTTAIRCSRTMTPWLKHRWTSDVPPRQTLQGLFQRKTRASSSTETVMITRGKRCQAIWGCTSKTVSSFFKTKPCCRVQTAEGENCRVGRYFDSYEPRQRMADCYTNECG